MLNFNEILAPLAEPWLYQYRSWSLFWYEAQQDIMFLFDIIQDPSILAPVVGC